MNSGSISLRADGASIYGEQRAEYLAQLVAPMDDMWLHFADQGQASGLLVGDEIVGSCSVDGDGQLLRFFVRPHAQHRSVELLRFVLRDLGVRRMLVGTVDPNYLSTALDVATLVKSHSLLYASILDPDGPGLGPTVWAEMADHAEIVEFQVAALGMPRDFLQGYVRGRIERRELVSFRPAGRLLCLGELRPDAQQAGVAQVGLVVHADQRGQGIGKRMLSTLVGFARGRGLAPYCSTEVGNLGARRAIEHAGFRAAHRLLRVDFEL